MIPGNNEPGLMDTAAPPGAAFMQDASTPAPSTANAAPNPNYNVLLSSGDLLKGLFNYFTDANQAGGDQIMGEFQTQQLLFNADLDRQRAQQELEKGEFEAGQKEEQTAQIEGTQIATQAAQGVSVNTGTSREIREQTGAIGAADAKMIEHNAALQAWGYDTKALNETQQAAIDALAAKNKAKNTMFEGEAGFFGGAFKALGDFTK